MNYSYNSIFRLADTTILGSNGKGEESISNLLINFPGVEDDSFKTLVTNLSVASTLNKSINLLDHGIKKVICFSVHSSKIITLEITNEIETEIKILGTHVLCDGYEESLILTPPSRTQYSLLLSNNTSEEAKIRISLIGI